MMYPYMTLDDDTEIVHSELKEDGTVKVYIETPDTKGGFYYAWILYEHDLVGIWNGYIHLD